MNRLTIKKETEYILKKMYLQEQENNYVGEAITKLANFENALEEIRSGYIDMGKRLKELRAKGEMKTTKFRELLGQKLVYSMIISILKNHNLLDIDEKL